MALSDFDADEYLRSDDYRDGVFDDHAQVQLIDPPERAIEREGFLVIGRPGVDGIEWGYRKAVPGIWAYYPVDDDFRKLADDLKQFLEGWNSGAITV